jgi:hypothetical protein
MRSLTTSPLGNFNNPTLNIKKQTNKNTNFYAGMLAILSKCYDMKHLPDYAPTNMQTCVAYSVTYFAWNTSVY